MLVEYARSPLAIDTRKPRFSWAVRLTGRGRRQSAYQLLVAGDIALLTPGKADMWDSGKVRSSQSVNVTYAGQPLASDRDYVWLVQVWDENDQPGGFSKPERFSTALLDERDWQAKWIGMGDAGEPFSEPATFQHDHLDPRVKAVEPDARSPMLRKPFVLDKPIRRARAFVCGLGLFELRLNGEKVGEDVLATPRTDFRKRAMYCTYDITSRLAQGDNVIGLLLGNGWFNGQKRYWGWQMQWYGSPRGIVQLDITFEDGSSRRIVSDESWRGGWSPITFNCLYDGEHYDARLEQPGWDAPGFDDGGWSAVNLVAAPGGRLVAVPHEPGRIVETIAPVSIRQPKPGVHVFDFGKNMTGWARLRVKGGKAGDVITLRYGEGQHADGAIDQSTNNKALQTDQYTLKGSGEEGFEPRFTYHGFQYVEVTGCPGEVDAEALTACFVRTEVKQTGSFECGHELLNRIHQCTLQSQRCNIQMGVPTDDTQRPERLGWAGDAWSYAEEAFYNFDAPRVFAKWIADFYDQQDETGMVGMIAPQAGAEEDLVWSAAFVLIPWWQYLHFGDRRILEDSYPHLKRYLDYLQRVGVKDVRPMTTEQLLKQLRKLREAKNRDTPESERGDLQISQWGDHLATNEGASGARKNQPLSIATAFYHMDVITMVCIAEVLGHADDAERYRELAGKIKEAFNGRFLDAAAGFYDVGCQSAQAWALAFDLVPDEHRQMVTNYLTSSVGHRQQRLTSGYAGTKWVVRAIAESGRNDIVWERAVATDYPSWGYMLRDPRRTTITENWMGKGSLCHTTLGAAIDEWFFRGLAGIVPDPAGPGYEKIIIKPYLPKQLPWAKASLQTVRGRIASHWQHDGQTAELRIEVPANSTATVHIPQGKVESITESGGPVSAAKGVTLIRSGQAESVFAVESGAYRFGFAI